MRIRFARWENSMPSMPQLAPSLAGWSTDFEVSDDLVGRLYRASQNSILDIASELAPRDRATLAAFCYARAHLHAIGLTIATACDLPALTHVFGSAVAHALHDQAREHAATLQPVPAARRSSKISLAKFQPSAARITDLDDDEPVERAETTAAPSRELVEA
jgi:hypothetical protein